MSKSAKKIGAVAGKFLPPHLGHMSLIETALRECDEVVVVLSDNPDISRQKCEKVGFPYFDSKKRVEWMKKHFKNEKNIKFYIIDERKLKKTPYDMGEWSALFKRTVKEHVNVKYADESYREMNKLYFPECEFIALDRTIIPISGTAIRENRDKLNFVIDEASPDIEKKLGGKYE